MSSRLRWCPLHLMLLFLIATQHCRAYTLTHTDVSNSTFYKELRRQNIIVVDEIHSKALGRRDSPTNATSANSTFVPTLNTDSGLPLPFDTSLGSNFTNTACPAYFQKFLNDNTFLSCLPVSLLLQNSMSFFQAAKSSALLKKTLDKSCSASLAVCSPLMAKLADDLISQSNCQADYTRQNPLVMQAYAGLRSYEPLYQATCLKSSSNSNSDYCFVEAMSTPNADDSLPYYTAVGLQLPIGSKPTCSTCLKNTMTVFAGYAVQKDQPLSNTYLGSATEINAVCGSGFASTQVKSVSKVATNNAIKSSTTGFASVFLVVLIASAFT